VAEVTAILLNYRRQGNVYRIIEALQRQDGRPEIMLIDNGPEPYPWVVPGRVVRVPWNAGPYVRIPFAVYAQTPWIMFLDDDLVPTDDQFVDDLRYIAELRQDCIAGLFGKRLIPGPHYYSDAPDADGWVHIVKGRCMMFHRSVLERVTLSNAVRIMPETHEDVYLSLEVGRGRPTNWVEPGMYERIEELPAPFALCDRPTHDEERDQVVAWHLGKIEVGAVLDRTDAIPRLCSRSELLHLWNCAMRAPALPMVECGVYQGASAAVLADVARRKGVSLTLVDNFQYVTPRCGQNSPERVQANLARAGVDPLPRIVTGDSRVVPEGLGAVGFLHIDTDHHAAHFHAEMDAWLPHMAPESVMAFHDYAQSSPEMIPAIDARLVADPAWACLGLVRWMIAFQKAGKP